MRSIRFMWPPFAVATPFALILREVVVVVGRRCFQGGVLAAEPGKAALGFKSRRTRRLRRGRLSSSAVAASKEVLVAGPCSKALDPVDGARQGFFVEEIGRGVRQLMRRPVEIVRAVRGADRITERDLVRDDQDRRVRPFEQLPKPRRITPGGIVEGLAARERFAAGVPPLPGPVLLDGHALE